MIISRQLETITCTACKKETDAMLELVQIRTGTASDSAKEERYITRSTCLSCGDVKYFD